MGTYKKEEVTDKLDLRELERMWRVQIAESGKGIEGKELRKNELDYSQWVSEWDLLEDE